jgi:hypothetical protein
MLLRLRLLTWHFRLSIWAEIQTAGVEQWRVSQTSCDTPKVEVERLWHQGTCWAKQIFRNGLRNRALLEMLWIKHIMSRLTCPWE